MKIYTEFFPQSSTYEYGNGIELEVYPDADTQNPNYFCKIRIAVNEKRQIGKYTNEYYSENKTTDSMV